MKKLVAAVAVAGVLLAGGSAAWAQSDGSGGSGASGGVAQQGRRGHGARLALRTAATTIGVSPQDLAGQIRGGKAVAAQDLEGAGVRAQDMEDHRQVVVAGEGELGAEGALLKGKRVAPLVHAVLHLIGYDHGAEMEARERTHA